MKQRGHVHYLTGFLVCVLIIWITGGVTAMNDTAEAVPEIVLQVSPVLGEPLDDPSGLISDDTGDSGNSAGESPDLTDQNGEPDPDGIEPGIPSPDPVSGVEPDSEITQDNPDQGILAEEDGSGKADGPDPEEPADMTGELQGDEETLPAVPPEPAPLLTPVEDSNTTTVSQEPTPLLNPVDDNNATTVSQEPTPLLNPVDDSNATIVSQEPALLLTPLDGNKTLPMPPEGAIISPDANQTLVAGNGTPGLIIADTNATILDPNLFFAGSLENLTLLSDNATPLLDAGCAGNQTVSEFNLSWTDGLTDPPLNATNLQGSPGSQYWEINGTTGSGYYPLDLIGLVTSSVYGIWIHDVSDIVLDGLGQTLQYNGAANQGATGVVIDGATSNIQIKNLTILGWDTGISITGADNVYVTDNTVISGNKDTGGTTGSGIVVKDSTNVYIISDLSAGSVSVTNNGRDGISYRNVTGGGINNTRVSDNGNNGVNLSYSQWITVENVTATLNSNGMLLDNASHNTITRSNASVNRNSGITLLSSDYNNLTGNTANGNYGSNGGDIGGNGYGIYLSGSDYNTLAGNNASGNFGGSTNRRAFSIDTFFDVSGVTVDDLDNILQNEFLGGSGYGICLDSSNFNNLTGNTAGGNYGGSSDVDIGMTTEGYLSGDAQYNGNYTFTDGLNGGNGYGISVTGSSGNNLTGNTASGNFGGSNGIFTFTYSLDQSTDATSHIDITFANISSGGSGYGIYLDGSSGNDLFDNSVTGNYGDEINVIRMYGMERHVNGADCTVGITNGVGGTLSANISFLNVNSGNSGYGIYLYGSDGNNLSGNTANENYGGLINGTSPDCEVTITNAGGADATINVDLQNVDTGNAGYGIYLSGSDNNNLTANIANQNSGGSGINGGNGGNGYGISLQLSDYNTLSGNTASNNYGGTGTIGGNGYGISLLLSNYTTLAGNNAANNYGGGGISNFSGSGGNGGNGYGISLQLSDYTNISGNTAFNNYGGGGGFGYSSGGTGGNGYGISLLQSNYTNISGNIVSENHGGNGGVDTISGNGGNGGNGYGIHLNGSNYNTLAGNNAANNYGGSAGWSFSGSGGTGGTGYGISLQLSDYNTLAGNYASGNFGTNDGRGISGSSWGTGYGISLLQSNYNNLTGNTANGNYVSSGGDIGGNGYGIYLSGSDYNTLAGNNASGNFGGSTNRRAFSIDTFFDVSGVTVDDLDNILQNEFLGGSGYGICLDSSNFNNLTGNTAGGNYGGSSDVDIGMTTEGYLSGDAQYNGNYTFTDGLNGGNGYGISVTGSSGNNLTGNTASGNFGGSNGIFTFTYSLDQSTDATSHIDITFANISSGGSGYGIYLDGSSGNDLFDNSVTGNYGDEINVIRMYGMERHVNGADCTVGITNGVGGTLSANISFLNVNSGNSGYGIYLYGSDGNNLSGNTANENYGGLINGTSPDCEVTITNAEGADATTNVDLQNVDTGNAGYGIYLSGSDNNNLTENTANQNSGGSGMNGGDGGNGYGIYLSGSDYNTLSGNHAFYNHGGNGGDSNGINGNGGNGYGILLLLSNYTFISRNTPSDNYGGMSGEGGTIGGNGGNGYGISLLQSDYTIIYRSAADRNKGGTGDICGNGGNGYGIHLNGSNYNTLSGNVVGEDTGGIGGSRGGNGYGIRLEQSDYNIVSENYAFKWFGIHATGGIGGNGYGISLLQSNYNTLSGNTANHIFGGNGTIGGNGYGIRIEQSDYTNISGNTASYNNGGDGSIGGNGYGISLLQSNYTNISGNTVPYNYGGNGGTAYGISLQQSYYTNISGNTANSNLGGTGTIGGNGYGIYLNGSDYNTLSGNTAAYNYGGNGTIGGNGGNGFGISLNGSNYNNLAGSSVGNNCGGIGGSGGNGGNGFGISLNGSNYNNISGYTAIFNTGGSGVEGGNGGNGYGISLLQSDYTNLSGNGVFVNSGGRSGEGGNGGNGYGISLLQSNYTNLSGNDVYNNHGGNGTIGGNVYGISLLQSDHNTLSGNAAAYNSGGNGTIGGNGYGIYLNGSNNNTFSMNAGSYNHGGFGATGGNSGSGYGIRLEQSDNNTFSGNYANSNSGGTGEYSTGIGHGIYLTQSSHNNLTGNNARWNTCTGFVIHQSDSNNLTGNEATGNEKYGFHIQYASDNTLTGNNASGNGEYGFYIEGPLGFGEVTERNTLTGNNATGNFIGFYLADANRTTFDNNTATGNEIGFHLRRSANTILSGNNASYNEANGIEMATSISNTIVGNIISNNGWLLISDGPLGKSSPGGLYLYETGDSIVTGNRITDNNGVGITVTDSEGNNIIYNNYFSNIQNALVTGKLEAPAPGPAPVITDFWYISPVPGANIIGGPYIGGNYWGTPVGTGWSQTHPDIGHGFTVPYDITGDGQYTDLHPLTLNPPVPPEYPGPYTMPVHPTLQWNAAFTSDSFPSAVCACSSTPVTVTVNNTGTTGWLADDVELGAFNDGAKLFSPVLVPLDPDTFVSPGYTYTFSFTLNAPCSPGTYNLEYRLVKNNGEWFGDTLSIVIDVNNCGQVSTVKAGKPVQTSRTSWANSASDLIAQKGTGLTVSPAGGRLAGSTGFSSMQAEALGQFAGTIVSRDT